MCICVVHVCAHVCVHPSMLCKMPGTYVHVHYLCAAVILVHPHQHQMRKFWWFWRIGHLEKLTNLPKVTQVIGAEPELGSRTYDSTAPVFTTGLLRR